MATPIRAHEVIPDPALRPKQAGVYLGKAIAEVPNGAWAIEVDLTKVSPSLLIWPFFQSIFDTMVGYDGVDKIQRVDWVTEFAFQEGNVRRWVQMYFGDSR